MNIENATWTAIVKCQAIFEALIKNGEEHFSQATHTPFASGLVADVLGPFEYNEVSQQILHGEFDIGSISDDIQLLSIISRPCPTLIRPTHRSRQQTYDRKTEARLLVYKGNYFN
jgi:hypothetical protein